MAFAYLGVHFQKVLLVQAALALVLAAMVGWGAGAQAGGSALVGAAAVLVSNLSYAWVTRPRKAALGAGSGADVLSKHVIAEVVKLVVLFLLIGATFSATMFASSWVLLGVAVAVLGHWLSLLL